MVVLRYKICDCNEVQATSQVNFSQQGKLLRIWSKALHLQLEFPWHLLPLYFWHLRSIFNKQNCPLVNGYLCFNSQMSISSLLSWDYSELQSFQVLHKKDEFYLFKNILQVITGSVMSCEVSKVFICFFFKCYDFFCFTNIFNLVMFECQEMNLSSSMQILKNPCCNSPVIK